MQVQVQLTSFTLRLSWIPFLGNGATHSGHLSPLFKTVPQRHAHKATPPNPQGSISFKTSHKPNVHQCVNREAKRSIHTSEIVFRQKRRKGHCRGAGSVSVADHTNPRHRKQTCGGRNGADDFVGLRTAERNCPGAMWSQRQCNTLLHLVLPGSSCCSLPTLAAVSGGHHQAALHILLFVFGDRASLL